MTSRTVSRVRDLRGAARLAVDATAGLADLVEAMHERIARLPGVAAPAAAGRTSGITGLVYKTVRGVTHLVGGSVDALLALLTPALDSATPGGAPVAGGAEREAIVAALNGVLGDHLVETANPLAVQMALRQGGRVLPLQPGDLAAALPNATPRLLVLAHGLCMNDLQWLRDGHDHGAALALDGGYTPVYLHYNTGRHVSANGRELAAILELLVAAWPQPLQRVVLIGHSMGGLVLRSAFHQAAEAGHAWQGRVDDLVFLGTPHHGAPLERVGHGVDRLLSATPYVSPFARLGRVRSAGITDLRHGNLLDEDWGGRDRFADGADRRHHLPLPVGPRCWALAGSLSEHSRSLSEQVLGDGLVPLASALGRHLDPARTLAFEPERTWVGQGIGHLALLSRREVWAQLRAALV
jgi:hypothetical protein